MVDESLRLLEAGGGFQSAFQLRKSGLVSGHFAKGRCYVLPLCAYASSCPPLASASVPIIGIAHISFNPMHKSMDPVERLNAFHGLDDIVRLLPFRADA